MTTSPKVKEIEIAASELEQSLDRVLDSYDAIGNVQPMHHKLRGLLCQINSDPELSIKEREIVDLIDKKLFQVHTKMVAAFHESAHAIAFHFMNINYRGLSLIAQGNAYARAEYIPYDRSSDGPVKDWAKRMAVCAFAGYIGELLIKPGEFSDGAIDDGEYARRLLEKYTTCNDEDISNLQDIAVQVVAQARKAIYLLAISLHKQTEIPPHQIRLIIDSSLTPIQIRAIGSLREKI